MTRSERGFSATRFRQKRGPGVLQYSRALYQFLDPKAAAHPKDDDVLAWQYVGSEATWQNALKEMPPSLADVNSRIGKEIAHLTYHRVSIGPVSNEWDISVIYNAMMRVVDLFVKSANPDNFSDEFRRQIAIAPNVSVADEWARCAFGTAVASTTTEVVLMRSESVPDMAAEPTRVNSIAGNRAFPMPAPRPKD